MTRLFYSLCLFLLTSTGSLKLLAATLTVSDNLIVTEIDNKIVDHGMLDNKSTFVLNKGPHALIVFYKDVFEDTDFAEDRVVKSKDFVVKFNITEEKQLKLGTVAIKNLIQAESFSKSPKLRIVDESNQTIEIELEKVSDYKISQQVNIAVNTYASQQSIKSIKSNKEPTIAKTPNVAKPMISPSKKKLMSNTLIQVNSLTMLKYWWQNASAQEKEHFKQFITSDN